MLGQIGQDQVSRNGRDLIRACLTEFTFNIVFIGKAAPLICPAPLIFAFCLAELRHADNDSTVRSDIAVLYKLVASLLY